MTHSEIVMCMLSKCQNYVSLHQIPWGHVESARLRENPALSSYAVSYSFYPNQLLIAFNQY